MITKKKYKDDGNKDHIVQTVVLLDGRCYRHNQHHCHHHPQCHDDDHHNHDHHNRHDYHYQGFNRGGRDALQGARNVYGISQQQVWFGFPMVMMMMMMMVRGTCMGYLNNRWDFLGTAKSSERNHALLPAHRKQFFGFSFSPTPQCHNSRSLGCVYIFALTLFWNVELQS